MQNEKGKTPTERLDEMISNLFRGGQVEATISENKNQEMYKNIKNSAFYIS